MLNDFDEPNTSFVELNEPEPFEKRCIESLVMKEIVENDKQL